MQPYKKYLTVILVTLGLLLVLPSSVAAAGKVSFKLSPTTIEDKVDPGMDRAFVLNVENQGDAAATLYPMAQNITGIGNSFE